MDQALIDEFNSRPKSRRGRRPKHPRTATRESGPGLRHEDEEMAGSGPDLSSDEDTDEERIEKHTTATRGQKRGKSKDNQSIKRTMKARKTGRKEKSARTSESEEEEEDGDEDGDEDVASEVTDPGEASERGSVDVDERRSDASEAVAPPVEVKEEPVEPAAATSSDAHVTVPVAAPAMVDAMNMAAAAPTTTASGVATKKLVLWDKDRTAVLELAEDARGTAVKQYTQVSCGGRTVTFEEFADPVEFFQDFTEEELQMEPVARFSWKKIWKKSEKKFEKNLKKNLKKKIFINWFFLYLFDNHLLEFFSVSYSVTSRGRFFFLSEIVLFHTVCSKNLTVGLCLYFLI